MKYLEEQLALSLAQECYNQLIQGAMGEDFKEELVDNYFYSLNESLEYLEYFFY